MRMKEAKKPRPCEICGTLFVPRSVNAKYCSDRCRDEASVRQEKERRMSKAPIGPRLVRCAICGRDFRSPSSGAKYCSNECRGLAEKRRLWERNWKGGLKREQNPKPYQRTCQRCGEVFQSAAPQTVYCPDCLEKQRREWRRWNADPEEIERICDTCGCRFRTWNHNVRNCPDCIAKNPSSSYRGGGIGGYSRRCHDCGTPTSDYRCPACRDRWRRKHRVAVSSEDEDGL